MVTTCPIMAVVRYFGPDARPMIVSLHDRRRGWTLPDRGAVALSRWRVERYRSAGFDALGLAVGGPGRGVAEFAIKELLEV